MLATILGLREAYAKPRPPAWSPSQKVDMAYFEVCAVPVAQQGGGGQMGQMTPPLPILSGGRTLWLQRGPL